VIATELAAHLIAQWPGTPPNGTVKPTHWLINPTVAQMLSQLKIGTSFNQSLLQLVDVGVQIAGIPALTSTHVDVGTVDFVAASKDGLERIVRRPPLKTSGI
jgi:hypothetical protein